MMMSSCIKLNVSWPRAAQRDGIIIELAKRINFGDFDTFISEFRQAKASGKSN
jgi:AraC-like DNA-binding protein